MKTASLECQIAQEQLKRYLGGVKLAPELVRGLERHLGGCPDCLAIARKGRQPDTPKSPKSAPKKMPGFALIDAAKSAVGRPTTDKKKAAMRTGILGGMLVLTLAAMGAISRNPEGLLGQRAMPVEAAPKKNPSTPPATREYFMEPLKGRSLAMVTQEDLISVAPEAEATPPPEAAPTAKPVIRATVSRKSTPPSPRKSIRRDAPVRRPAPAKPKPKSDSGSIRVYDASGRPVQPN